MLNFFFLYNFFYLIFFSSSLELRGAMAPTGPLSSVPVSNMERLMHEKIDFRVNLFYACVF
jgi:hypothetical protein